MWKFAQHHSSLTIVRAEINAFMFWNLSGRVSGWFRVVGAGDNRNRDRAAATSNAAAPSPTPPLGAIVEASKFLFQLQMRLHRPIDAIRSQQLFDQVGECSGTAGFSVRTDAGAVFRHAAQRRFRSGMATGPYTLS